MENKDDNDIPEIFWSNTKTKMASMGLNRKELAELIGVQAQSLATAKYKNCDIRVSLAYRIAQALNTTVGTLISDNGENYLVNKAESTDKDENDDLKNYTRKVFREAVTRFVPKLTPLQINTVMTLVFAFLGRDYSETLKGLNK